MPATAETWTVFDEYWYDALGRRVAVRTRVDSTEHCTASETFSTPTACQQQFLRTTWDGDQVLFEERFVGGWQEVDGNVGESTPSTDWYGKVRYTQTGAIDAPVAVWRLAGSESWRPRVLHRNWRGNVAGATFGPGSGVGQVDGSTVWPAAVTDLYHAPDARQSAPAANKWLGSLVTDGKDATGTLYRRNRYYDPASGRFTQQDPIGLAGGLNLYGYAGGDPVNYDDPFGLCKNPLARGLGNLKCALEDAWSGAVESVEAMATGAARLARGIASRVSVGFSAQGLQEEVQESISLTLERSSSRRTVLSTELGGVDVGAQVQFNQAKPGSAEIEVAVPLGNPGTTAGIFSGTITGGTTTEGNVGVLSAGIKAGFSAPKPEAAALPVAVTVRLPKKDP